MDDKLLRQLVRQLRFINIFLAVFGGLMLLAMIAIGVLLYQVVSFTQEAVTSVDTFQQETRDRLDVRQQACESNRLGSFLRSNSNVCE